MKLLGWMNRKLRQNSIEPLKNVSIGISSPGSTLFLFPFFPLSEGNSCSCFSVQSSIDEQGYHSQPCYSSQTKRACPKYPTGVTDNKDEEILKEEPSIRMSELFHGFLTIGTLGTEQIITEPTSPRFAISFQNINEKETEITDNELKLINDKLEKLLEAEAKEKDYESSERSYVSTITLSNDQIEGVDDKEHQNMATRPLQGYLYGSSLECPETGEEIKKEKRSVGELFKNNTNAYKQYKEQSKKEGAKSKGTYAMHFRKKMLKKIHIPSRSCTLSVNGLAADSVSTKRKLPKTLRTSHRRIHPERSTAAKKFTKSDKYENKNTSQSGKNKNGDVTFLDCDNKTFLRTTMLKEEITTMSICHNRLSGSYSTGNGEHWIKTDAEYLVLEL